MLRSDKRWPRKRFHELKQGWPWQTARVCDGFAHYTVTVSDIVSWKRDCECHRGECKGWIIVKRPKANL